MNNTGQCLLLVSVSVGGYLYADTEETPSQGVIVGKWS